MSSLRNESWNLSLTKLEAFEKTFHNKPIHVQLYISNGIFLNQPNEICTHASEKASKGRRFVRTRSSKTTVTKEKEGKKERVRKRKGGREKKAMVALFVFIIATLERVFARK